MNTETLKRGIILEKTIIVTKQGLDNLKKFYNKKQSRLKKRGEDNPYDDGLYMLNIGEFSDMSGDSAELKRYGGNMKVLEVIIKEVERQLEEYTSEFESL